MTSAPISRLTSNIEKCAQLDERYCLMGLMAELACCWSRIGSIDEAERLCQDLHESLLMAAVSDGPCC